jgi:hypothetical protein
VAEVDGIVAHTQRQTPRWRVIASVIAGAELRLTARRDRTARSRRADDAMVIVGERLGLRAHGVTVTAGGLTASSWA